MDARSLALEMAPILIWTKGRRPEQYKQFWNHTSKVHSKTNMDPTPTPWDLLAGYVIFNLCLLARIEIIIVH